MTTAELRDFKRQLDARGAARYGGPGDLATMLAEHPFLLYSSGLFPGLYDPRLKVHRHPADNTDEAPANTGPDERPRP